MTGIQSLTGDRGFKRFAVLQIADIATTLIGFSLAGVQAELNPFMRIFPVSFGPVAGLFIGKFLIAALFLGFMSARFDTAWDVKRLWNIVNVWFIGVVVWNFFQIFRYLAYK